MSDAQLAQLLRKIEDYGRDWFREHNPSTVSAVVTKRGSFAEVLGRVYFQGRPDKMSFQVLDTVRLILHRLGWEVQEFEPWIESLSSPRLREALEGAIGPGKVGKGLDVDLTVGLIEWVKKLPDHNISAHVVELLSHGQLTGLYKELQQIRSVGPKIASFVLRDFILGLELAGKGPYPFKSDEEYVCVMPIDVHVAKAASELADLAELGLEPPTDPNSLLAQAQALAQALAQLCQRHNCNPQLVDQGMFGLNYLDHKLSSAINFKPALQTEKEQEQMEGEA